MRKRSKETVKQAIKKGKITFATLEQKERKKRQDDFMMVNNNLIEYKELSKLSILDYYTYIEVVNKNTAKMNKHGNQGTDSLRSR